MRELGEAGRAGDSLKDLAAEVEDEHENERERDGAGSHAGERREHDEHEHDAGRAHERAVREEEPEHQPRDERRERDGEQDALAAEALLGRGADDEQHDNVAAIGGEIRVAEHVQEKARVGQPVRQRRAVDAKKVLRRPAVGELAEAEREQAQQCEREDDGRIIQDRDGMFLHMYLSKPNARRSSGTGAVMCRGCPVTGCVRSAAAECSAGRASRDASPP